MTVLAIWLLIVEGIVGRERYDYQVGWRCFRVGVIVRTGTSLITFKDSSYSLCFPSLSPDNVQGQQLLQPRLSQPSHFSLLFTASVTVCQDYWKQPWFLQRGRICPDSLLRTVWVPPCILCFQEVWSTPPSCLSLSHLFSTLCSPVSYCSCYPISFSHPEMGWVLKIIFRLISPKWPCDLPFFLTSCPELWSCLTFSFWNTIALFCTRAVLAPRRKVTTTVFFRKINENLLVDRSLPASSAAFILFIPISILYLAVYTNWSTHTQHAD